MSDSPSDTPDTEEERPEAVTLEKRVPTLLEGLAKIIGEHVEPAPPYEVLYAESNRPVRKALAAVDTTQSSNALPSNDDVHTIFTLAGALFPPFDPQILVAMAEHSNSLRPNVDGYEVNIESFGYRLEPVIDLDKEEAREKLGDAMFLERLRAQELAGGAAQANYPSDAEIEARKAEVKALMRLEHAQLTNFFERCAGTLSFTELRERTRHDLELTGNAYWEVLRNEDGEICQFEYVPSYSMRLIPIEHRLHEYALNQKVSLLDYETVTQRRRFRRFIQVVLDRIVHFKEFGDPRTISRRTGQHYPSLEELKRSDDTDGAATEIIHFRIHTSRSPYGIPRWIGALLSVLGSRYAEEVNILYFDNKAVPPLAVLVSGGSLKNGSEKKIADYIQDNIKGKQNFHRILILEAEAAANANPAAQGRCRITLQPLSEAQQQDALFQGYDERNIDKVGMAFRMPRLLRGDVRDFNRATAEAAVAFAETQVFQPERQRFDDKINRMILTDMKCRFWRFVSKSPVNRAPEQIASLAQTFGTIGALVPNELRKLASEALNMDFPQIEEEWAKQPMVLTAAGLMSPDGLPPDVGAPGAPGAPATPVDVSAPPAPDGSAPPPGQPPPAPAAKMGDPLLMQISRNLVALRRRLGQRAGQHFAQAAATTKSEGELVLRVSREQMDAWVDPDAAG